MAKSFNTLASGILLMLLSTGASGQYITTIAGTGTIPGYSGDGGQATNARLHAPSDIAFDATGNLYITDFLNNVIRKVDTFGIITTIAGTGYGAGSAGGGFSGDGGPATDAKLNGPYALVLDALDNIIFADGYNHIVRKVTPSGTITTIAGFHTLAGYSGDGGMATDALLNNPVGIAIDKFGNIYIADDHNNAIRKINTSGTMSTIAGHTTAGYSGDGGPAIAAELNLPIGVGVDTAGNLFIADANNNVIRKVSKTGIISTYAGTGIIAGYSGDGGPATAALLDSPTRVNFDEANNLYISDYYNNVIRKVNPVTRIITTVAGNGYGAGTSGTTGGYSGDDSLAINANLYLPHGVAFDQYHRMYIADRLNAVIRRVGPKPAVDHASVSNISGEVIAQLNVYPNPSSNGEIMVNLVSDINMNVQIIVTDLMGRTIQKTVTETNKTSTINLGKITGIYFLNATTKEGHWNAKIFMQD